MLELANVPDIDSEEMTARFIVSKRHINRQSNTAKADAFVPHPYDELSITRHIECSDSEIWSVGQRIARDRTPPRTLHGRGDVLAATYLSQKLDVVADPDLENDNPNHALVLGWVKDDKAKQLLVAKEIAAVAKLVLTPSSD